MIEALSFEFIQHALIAAEVSVLQYSLDFPFFWVHHYLL
jgi:hypothetical protein